MLFKVILKSEMMNENTAQWDGLVWLAENIKTIIDSSESQEAEFPNSIYSCNMYYIIKGVQVLCRKSINNKP